MSNDLIAVDGVNDTSGMFEGASIDDMRSASTGGSFPVMSIKSSRFRVRPAGGEMQPLVSENGDPMQSIECVIVDAQKGVSKSWYSKAYGDGDTESPDCYSDDGVEPRPDAKDPQAKKCAVCPKNQWGSFITPAGKKAKACRDVKRLAVTFASNLHNQELGGPMLLRVPGASHKDMDKFVMGMKSKGYKIQTVAVRLGFDVDAAYPKLTFKAIRALGNDELPIVNELFHSEQVRDVLAGQQHSTVVASAPSPAPLKLVDSTVDCEFETPPEQPKKVAAAPAEKPTPAVQEPTSVISGLDDIMGDLDLE